MFERMIAISWCLICLGTCYLKEFVKFAFFHSRFILPFLHISNFSHCNRKIGSSVDLI